MVTPAPLLEAAKELQCKLEADRVLLSKNQVKKQRKKLSKLFNKATSSQGVSDSIAETSGSADQAASLRALELKQQLQDQRDQLSRNQLKKQRKKLSKLFNKASQGPAAQDAQQVTEDGTVSGSLYTTRPDAQIAAVTSPPAKRRKVGNADPPALALQAAAGAAAAHPVLSGSVAASHAAPSSTVAYPPTAAEHNQQRLAADPSISVACSTGGDWSTQQGATAAAPAPYLQPHMRSSMGMQQLARQVPAHQQQQQRQQQPGSQCRMDLSLQAGLILHQLHSTDAGTSAADDLTCCVGPPPEPHVGMQQQQEQQEQQDQDEQQQDEQQDGEQPGSKRNRKTPYMFGNYHRYYGYRLGTDMEKDPRIKVMQPEWFSGRRCLDMGCNEGLLTLGLATKFGCDSMLGLDIDAALVHKAARHLRESRAEATAKLQQPGLPDRQGQLQALRARVKALSKVHFRQEDFVSSYTKRASVDTLCCFSVTKWVHLIHGDDGIMRLFGKFLRTLVPGGYLVLEPQMWKSYKNAAKQQDSRGQVTYQALDSLKLRPEQFQEYLTQRLGFVMVADVQVAKEECMQGFDRPLWVLQKPE